MGDFGFVCFIAWIVSQFSLYGIVLYRNLCVGEEDRFIILIALMASLTPFWALSAVRVFVPELSPTIMFGDGAVGFYTFCMVAQAIIFAIITIFVKKIITRQFHG